MREGDEGPVRLAVPATGLPGELFYFYLAAPILMAPVFQRNIFELPLEQALRSIAANYVPFLAIPAGLHLAYRQVLPRLLGRVGSLGGRLVGHILATGLVAVGVALLISPVFRLLIDGKFRLAAFVSTGVVISWLFVLPALVMQELHRRAAEVERRLQEERQASLRAQLEALQLRTNPHFLFNALNTIASLIPHDPELAERTVERLADLLRHSLQSTRQEVAPLGRELDLLRDYLEVQRARFGERLRYQITVEPGLEQVLLPPLLLQPLVENAVLHGVASQTAGGELRVEVRLCSGQLLLQVEDDGPGPGASRHQGTGTSLQDLRRRLELLYGQGYHLALREGAGGGTLVELRVPAGRS